MGLPVPRFIRPENVCIGDTIRVETVHEDVTFHRTGVVAKREYEGSDRVLYTAAGVRLCVWNPAHKGPRVTLLQESATQVGPTLF